jgi:hypothetical protein
MTEILYHDHDACIHGPASAHKELANGGGWIIRTVMMVHCHRCRMEITVDDCRDEERVKRALRDFAAIPCNLVPLEVQ